MLDRKEIIRVYGLASLELREDEIEKIQSKYSKVLAFAQEILQVDTSQVEPTELITEHNARLREDTVAPSVSREDALKNARDREFGYFKLRRVVD